MPLYFQYISLICTRFNLITAQYKTAQAHLGLNDSTDLAFVKKNSGITLPHFYIDTVKRFSS